MNASLSAPPLIADGDQFLSSTEAAQKRLALRLLALTGSFVGVIILCAAAKFCLASGLVWQCPFMTLFHVPCPGCGSTRAFSALAEMRFLTALRFNPLMVGALLFGPVAFALRDRLSRHAPFGWLAFGSAIVLNWVYLYFFLPR
jgi:hypothetical protein